MNWFTREVVEHLSSKEKKTLLEQDSGCDHVVGNIDLAYTMHSEKDSFGPVSTHVVCKECDKAIDEEEGNQECTCRDCKQTVKKKDGIEWKWYDFYAPQGDEPIFVCKACRSQPPHQNRLAKDRADYEAEFGRSDEDDSDDN